MRRVARAEDRETAGKLREFFLSQGIDAEISPAGGAFEILVDDAKAEEALLMAKSLFESARERRNQWADGSADASPDGKLGERIRGAASALLSDIVLSFRPVTWTVLAFIIISYILELTVPGDSAPHLERDVLVHTRALYREEPPALGDSPPYFRRRRLQQHRAVLF